MMRILKKWGLSMGMLGCALSVMGNTPQPDNRSGCENGIVMLDWNHGFSLQTKDQQFVFKPYLLAQMAGTFNYYDDEGLDKAYNQDNVANSGFSIPYAILGFTGKAWDRVVFNLSINAAGSGGGILQQAWVDVRAKDKDALHVKVGKFKTPFAHAYLTTLGESLFPKLPTSATATVILPYSLNAVTPCMGMGFDLGVELHGVIEDKFGYEFGIFNGTGGNVNLATKTFSDDWHIPSMLYAGRLTYMPNGMMPATQGRPNLFVPGDKPKFLVGLSGSLNVESENESTNDARMGVEFAMLNHKLYLAGEMYWMHVGFTKRQKIDKKYNYLGGYVQCGYFVAKRLQAALRYDMFARNGLDTKGFLNMPAVGVNYFLKWGLKLQAMYEYTARKGHKTQLDRDMDDLGLSVHTVKIQVQYTF